MQSHEPSNSSFPNQGPHEIRLRAALRSVDLGRIDQSATALQLTSTSLTSLADTLRGLSRQLESLWHDDGATAAVAATTELVKAVGEKTTSIDTTVTALNTAYRALATAITGSNAYHEPSWAEPVSYTHLDVYKRQHPPCPAVRRMADPSIARDGRPAARADRSVRTLSGLSARHRLRARRPPPTPRAVSYTHLDVYKRQGHGPSAVGLPGERSAAASLRAGPDGNSRIHGPGTTPGVTAE